MNIIEGKRSFDFLISLGSAPKNWNRVLYIGWHPDTFGVWKGQYYIERILEERGEDSVHVIVERSNVYFNKLKTHNVTRYYNIECVRSDIVDWSKEYDGEKFDLVIWWHGPEHIEEKYLRPTLKNLEKICRGSVILGFPDGLDEKNIADNYVDHVANDKHHYNVTEKDVKDEGYETVIFTRGHHGQGKAITAIKIVNQ